MDFTYQSYRNLLQLLKEKGYSFVNYHNYTSEPRCVILRHDIDTDLEKAVTMAQIEAEMGVHSTWFVLLRTDFYNPASAKAQKSLRKILSLGHEIGLHFDELSYPSESVHGGGAIVRYIEKEASVLSELCGQPVTVVSMHRPSSATLEADYQIPGILNSYGKTFFREFKYLSDSRRRWREPVLDIIQSREYDRLHILTHAFWYQETNESISDTVSRFIWSGNQFRYDSMMENITDLPSILGREDI